MLESIKPKVQKSKEFVQEHQTIIACAATAAVTFKLTRDYNFARFGRIILAMGNELDVVNLREAVLRDFISTKGLKEELLTDFIPNKVKSV